MRYEHILKYYWSKGYFFGSELFYFNQTFYTLFDKLEGFNDKFKKMFVYRFELTFSRRKNKNTMIDEFENKPRNLVRKPLNSIFALINSVNHRVHQLKRVNIIRLYLIKSYKGRCHALGKPVNSQRTWSNAWQSFKKNTILRSYISEMLEKINKEKRPEKINYRLITKKYLNKHKKKNKKEEKVFVKAWF